MNKGEADRALERARTLKTRLEGQREILGRRHLELEGQVALAKGRALARPALDLLLEAVQADENHEVLGTYARLLSAISGDVLGPDIEIDLKLGTERGLPALDIVSKRGERERNIFESESGSLTNIVCTALRAIATSRSGLRKFLAFDEPDCWLEQVNAPAFFGVLVDMSRRTDTQIVVITHRRLTGLGPDVNVIELVGTAETGLRAVVQPGAPGWGGEDEVGLRSVSLRNFASFEDCHIPLSPGINVIIGANRIGKSRLTRALRSVFYGGSDSSDEDIRDGSGTAEVDIRIEGGRTLYWSRSTRRNPVTKWRLVEADGSVCVVGPQNWYCEEGGRAVPEWVGSPLTMGIAKVDGLDIQIAHQKIPVFLLSSATPASQRAKVLSVGGESGMLRDMIALGKKERTEDSTTVRAGEAEITRLRMQLAHLEDLEGVGNALEVAESMGASLEAASAQAAAAQQACHDIERRMALLQRAGLVVEAAQRLPSLPDIGGALEQLRDAGAAGVAATTLAGSLERARDIIDACTGLAASTPQFESTDDVLALVCGLEANAAALARQRSVLGALGGLPRDIAAPEPTDPMQDRAQTLEALAAGLAAAGQQAAHAGAQQVEQALELAALMDGLGHLCPLCGTPGIDHQHILSVEAQ